LESEITFFFLFLTLSDIVTRMARLRQAATGTRGIEEHAFPSQLKAYAASSTEGGMKLIRGVQTTWLAPTSLADLLRAKAECPSAKIVCGNTEIGIETRFGRKEYEASVLVWFLFWLFCFWFGAIRVRFVCENVLFYFRARNRFEYFTLAFTFSPRSHFVLMPRYPYCISPVRVPDLNCLSLSASSLEIGAALPLASLMHALEARVHEGKLMVRDSLGLKEVCSFLVLLRGDLRCDF
jgi:hypothetical protein